MEKSSTARDSKECFRLLTQPGVKLNTGEAVNQDILLVNSQSIDKANKPLKTSNVVIAAYTVCSREASVV